VLRQRLVAVCEELETLAACPAWQAPGAAGRRAAAPFRARWIVRRPRTARISPAGLGAPVTAWLRSHRS